MSAAWIRAAKAGDRVVFVGGYSIRVWKRLLGVMPWRTAGRHYLLPGEIYEIRSVHIVNMKDGSEAVGFRLQGFRLMAWGYDLPFPSVLFRPLEK